MNIDVVGYRLQMSVDSCLGSRREFVAHWEQQKDQTWESSDDIPDLGLDLAEMLRAIGSARPYCELASAIVQLFELGEKPNTFTEYKGLIDAACALVEEQARVTSQLRKGIKDRKVDQ